MREIGPVRTKLQPAETEDEEKYWARAARTTLRAYRDDADLSQEEVATRCGWTLKTQQNLESGRKAMDIRYVVRIARAIGIEPATAFAQITHWVQSNVRSVARRAKGSPR
jgi:transcriptional regulator with XRE-family HTH domain